MNQGIFRDNDKGWECPRCGKINAPWMPHCTCQGDAKQPWEPTCDDSTAVKDYRSNEDPMMRYKFWWRVR